MTDIHIIDRGDLAAAEIAGPGLSPAGTSVKSDQGAPSSPKALAPFMGAAATTAVPAPSQTDLASDVSPALPDLGYSATEPRGDSSFWRAASCESVLPSTLKGLAVLVLVLLIVTTAFVLIQVQNAEQLAALERQQATPSQTPVEGPPLVPGETQPAEPVTATQTLLLQLLGPLADSGAAHTQLSGDFSLAELLLPEQTSRFTPSFFKLLLGKSR